MIVPMKKVSLLLLASQKEDSLQKLRRLGLMHIAITEGTSRQTETLKEQISLLQQAIYSVGKPAKNGEPAAPLSPEEALSVAAAVAAAEQEKKGLIAERFALQTEWERLAEWGDIDPADYAYLAQKGVDLHLFALPKGVYDGLDDRMQTVVLSKTKSTVKCLLWRTEEVDEEAWNSLATYEVPLPTQSTATIRQRMTACEEQIKATEENIRSYATHVDRLKGAVTLLEKEVEFHTYASGIAAENLSDREGDRLDVAYFTGFIEVDQVERLKAAAAENGWGMLVEDPTQEDNVPTKLKNNRFVSLIYPLTDFLGTLPGYFEYDISGWFLAFILIFFGIIFGDGGYGLFILAVAAIPIIRALAAKKPVSPMFLLIGLFGLSTVAWGTLTCTWFGLSPDQLPVWLQNLSVPVISNVYADTLWYPFWTNGTAGLTTGQNLQILCFSLALVQLTVAHIKGAVRHRHSLQMLGDIGSILQLVGIYYIVLSLVVNPQVFPFGLVVSGIPIGGIAIGLIGIGFVMSFIFANYEGNLVKSILASLTNIVSVLLGVVNVFSDIVSYIRLWAVGLAGAAISATVNELAGPLLGNFLFMVLAIVLLVFGHGLNMILNVLSVIVHGIRLNTLEFSSHLDMSWSGHPFKPFEE